jgi:hypothetical protein
MYSIDSCNVTLYISVYDLAPCFCLCCSAMYSSPQEPIRLFTISSMTVGEAMSRIRMGRLFVMGEDRYSLSVMRGTDVVVNE